MVSIACQGVAIEGELVPATPGGPVVVFAHGSGSSRHSPRNRQVAQYLNERGIGTLLLDLLTAAEEVLDAEGGQLRFDIGFLAGRLVAASDWLAGQKDDPGRLGLGYFGASTGAAAALVAAADQGDRVGAIVSRAGRPDLAGEALGRVTAPTLLIVGGNDPLVAELNRDAMLRMAGEVRLETVPGAGHLFEEAGTLEQVARLAGDWFTTWLVAG